MSKVTLEDMIAGSAAAVPIGAVVYSYRDTITPYATKGLGISKSILNTAVKPVAPLINNSVRVLGPSYGMSTASANAFNIKNLFSKPVVAKAADVAANIAGNTANVAGEVVSVADDVAKVAVKPGFWAKTGKAATSATQALAIPFKGAQLGSYAALAAYSLMGDKDKDVFQTTPDWLKAVHNMKVTKVETPWDNPNSTADDMYDYDYGVINWASDPLAWVASGIATSIFNKDDKALTKRVRGERAAQFERYSLAKAIMNNLKPTEKVTSGGYRVYLGIDGADGSNAIREYYVKNNGANGFDVLTVNKIDNSIVRVNSGTINGTAASLVDENGKDNYYGRWLTNAINGTSAQPTAKVQTNTQRVDATALMKPVTKPAAKKTSNSEWSDEEIANL